MSEPEQWDRWLAAADTDGPLQPGFDNNAALIRLEGLQWRLVSALPAYQLRTIPAEPLQHATGLACLSVYPSDAGILSPTCARVLLSRFGDLATVRGCRDRELLATISGVLDDYALRYIPYDYLITKTYDGKCEAFLGTTLENRYFSMRRAYTIKPPPPP